MLIDSECLLTLDANWLWMLIDSEYWLTLNTDWLWILIDFECWLNLHCHNLHCHNLHCHNLHCHNFDGRRLLNFDLMETDFWLDEGRFLTSWVQPDFRFVALIEWLQIWLTHRSCFCSVCGGVVVSSWLVTHLAVRHNLYVQDHGLCLCSNVYIYLLCLPPT